MDTGELLDAHVDAVWRQVAAQGSDGARVVDVVVGTFRGAGPGADGPSLARTALRMAARASGRPTSAITRLDVRPEAAVLTDELRAVVRARVLAETDVGSPTPSRRRGRLVGAAVLVVAVVGGLVWLARPDSPAVTAAPVPPTVVPRAVAAASAAAASAAQRADTDLAGRRGFPASGDLVTDQHLARCAEAVRRSGRAADYPALATWRVGQTQAGSTGITTVVSDAFACSTTPTTVYVSGASGVRAGAVQLARSGPGQLVVLNPLRATVTFTPLSPRSLSGTLPSSGPVQLVGLFDTLDAPFGLDLTVAAVDGTTFRAAVPDPGPTAVVLDDVRLPPPDRTSTAGALLGRCLASPFGSLTPAPDAWSATTATTVSDGTSVVAVHAPGMAGVCAERAGQLVFASFPVADPEPAGMVAPVTQVGAVGGDPRSYTVLAVDSRAVELRVEGTTQDVTCLVDSGAGVCTAPTSTFSPATVTAYSAQGDVVAGPAVLALP